jgi:hypothetical protein
MLHDFCLPAAVKPGEALRLLTPQRKTFRQPVESDLNRNSHSKVNETNRAKFPELSNLAAASPEPMITAPFISDKRLFD